MYLLTDCHLQPIAIYVASFTELLLRIYFKDRILFEKIATKA